MLNCHSGPGGNIVILVRAATPTKGEQNLSNSAKSRLIVIVLLTLTNVSSDTNEPIKAPQSFFIRPPPRSNTYSHRAILSLENVLLSHWCRGA